MSTVRMRRADAGGTPINTEPAALPEILQLAEVGKRRVFEEL